MKHTVTCKYYIGHAFEDRKTFFWRDAHTHAIWVEWVGLKDEPSVVPDTRAKGWRVTDGFSPNDRSRLSLVQAMDEAHKELAAAKIEWDKRYPETE